MNAYTIHNIYSAYILLYTSSYCNAIERLTFVLCVNIRTSIRVSFFFVGLPTPN